MALFDLENMRLRVSKSIHVINLLESKLII